ncbi:MAG TPA: hypothetical protein VGS96_22995 [Thermoanaerobaculia bacterium]|jgi:hypothetical protein|nr:hypothetical protein [Thermoanaerobaculia bacterium]
MTEFTEDRVPVDGIEEAISELVDLYGGEIKASRRNEREFILPLRRGVAASGGIQCTISWTNETVRLVCDRDVDAPKGQRVAMLIVGVIGALFFMIWPFFPHQQELGTLAWMGGFVALAVYLLTLRRTSGGIAFDFLQRLAQRQRG